ncbi:MAG: TonB-dependent receptor, partial [Campylobacterota bacterium]|nr:TonB-dependent receptor [Campylobacterota bacterium]
MRSLLLLFLLTTLLFSQELILDNLLKEYEDSESLYKKTKKESAGFLLVYSREDLEKMQAYSLKDVLKTIRIYTMQINNIGVLKLQKVAQGKSSLPPIKLYIDDFEITTVVQGNALDTYGDMDIYFVDHIEVYQGGSSIAFGNSPGSMVIRLYSKDPSRENSRSAQLSVDSKAGGNLRVIDAGLMGEYKYLLYGSAAKIDYDTYSRKSQELSRDAKRYQAHFKISQDKNFEVVIDAISTKSDIFNGFGSAPLGDNSIRSYGYINATKFFEGNLKASLSASLENKDVANNDAVGIQLPNDLPNTPTGNNFKAKVLSNTYKATLEKKIISGKNDFLIGAEFQQNKFDVKNYEGVGITPYFGPDKLNIYMLYLEELYNINENHLLAFSGKLDHYRDSFSKDSTEYSIRLGYIAILNESWSSKLFAIRRYIYPNMLQTSFTPPSYKPNPELNSAKINMITGELEYNDKKYRAVFGYAYKEIDESIGFNAAAKEYINKTDTVYFNRVYIRGEHQFDFDNKIIIEYFKGYKENYASPGAGALVQLFNRVGKFNLYNELIYRESYTLDYGAGDIKMNAGYDYTLSISYPLNRSINLKAKGENLLDKGSETLIDAQG